jgi:uncharacterized protein (TIRG00374 family)
LRVVRSVVPLAVVAVVFLYALPRIVDYRDVWAALAGMTWLELSTLGALAVWNLMTYALLEAAARPGLSLGRALTITLTSTTIGNALPAGAALGVGVQTGMYVSYGFAKPDIAVSLMTTGIWNTFTKLGMPVVALALLAIGGTTAGGLLFAALIGILILAGAIGVFAVVLWSDRGALAAGRGVGRLAARTMGLFGRPFERDVPAAFSGFRRRAIDLLRIRWLPITSATLVSHVTLYLVLLLALRHMGVSNGEVSWQEALAAFAFVRLLSVVPITPGGVGVVELGMTAALVAAGGDEGQVVASVIVFRALTFVLPIPLGALTYMAWRRQVADRTGSTAVPA